MNSNTNSYYLAKYGGLLIVKRAIAYVLCHPLVGKFIGFVFGDEIPHSGNKIECPRDIDPRIRAMIFWGIYESSEIRFVRKYLDGNLDVIELGSSLGVVSCEIAKKLKSGRRLYCIEANPNVQNILTRNLDRNLIDKHFNVISGAIDYKNQKYVDFTISQNNLESKLGCHGASSKVPSLRLSSILEKESVLEYALVSDIEGAEIQILLHDVHALLRCKLLIIELHSVTHDGVAYDPNLMISLIEKNTSLRLRERYGNTCVFIQKSINL